MKKMKKTSIKELDEQCKDYNITSFSEKSFILAGPKTNLVALYNLLKKHGVYDFNCSRSKECLQLKQVVILCKTVKSVGLVCSKTYPSVSVLSKSWWDYWHDPQTGCACPKIKTYNIPKQQEEVFKKLVLTKMEEIIPE